MNATATHAFKYDRPMDPHSAMSKLEDLAELFVGDVDITDNDGPNQAMQATYLAKEVAGGMERAIHGMRLVHSSTADFLASCAPAELDNGYAAYARAIQQTVRHALAALGERP